VEVEITDIWKPGHLSPMTRDVTYREMDISGRWGSWEKPVSFPNFTDKTVRSARVKRGLDPLGRGQ
jgi:hypothetical protein